MARNRVDCLQRVFAKACTPTHTSANMLSVSNIRLPRGTACRFRFCWWCFEDPAAATWPGRGWRLVFHGLLFFRGRKPFSVATLVFDVPITGGAAIFRAPPRYVGNEASLTSHKARTSAALFLIIAVLPFRLHLFIATSQADQQHQAPAVDPPEPVNEPMPEWMLQPTSQPMKMKEILEGGGYVVVDDKAHQLMCPGGDGLGMAMLLKVCMHGAHFYLCTCLSSPLSFSYSAVV